MTRVSKRTWPASRRKVWVTDGIIGVGNGVIGIRELGQRLASDQGRGVPAGLDGADLACGTERTGTRPRTDWARLQGMLRAVGAGGLERGDRLGDGSFLKAARLSSQEVCGSVSVIRGALRRIGTGLPGPAGPQEVAGEELAIAGRHRAIQLGRFRAPERPPEHGRGARRIAQLGADRAQVQLAAELPARLAGQPLGKLGSLGESVLCRVSDDQLLDRLGVVGLEPEALLPKAPGRFLLAGPVEAEPEQIEVLGLQSWRTPAGRT